VKDGCEDEISLRRTNRQGAGRPKKAATPEPLRIPRVSRLMALAIKFQHMVDRGEVRDYADLARLGFVTRARITQIMNLLNLAPRIQESLLFLDSSSGGCMPVSEHDLRTVAQAAAWPDQHSAFDPRLAS